jgi:hypothetical protein
MTMCYHIQLQFSIKVLKLKFIVAYLSIILDYASFSLYEPFPTNLATKSFLLYATKSLKLKHKYKMKKLETRAMQSMDP